MFAKKLIFYAFIFLFIFLLYFSFFSFRGKKKNSSVVRNSYLVKSLKDPIFTEKEISQLKSNILIHFTCRKIQVSDFGLWLEAAGIIETIDGFLDQCELSGIHVKFGISY
jgi:hypothetical protein